MLQFKCIHDNLKWTRILVCTLSWLQDYDGQHCLGRRPHLFQKLVFFFVCFAIVPLRS